MSDSDKRTWYKLDNAAKIFPPTSSKSDTKVFRFSCELFEAIDGVMLQTALNRTIEDFPGFLFVLKGGLFWYYLEQSSLLPIVTEEDHPPCSKDYLNSRTLLFDVTYYNNRINLDIYHALTDGTGAMQFLKALVLYYLKIAHPEAMESVHNIDYDASETQKMTDSFKKYYDKSQKIKVVKKATAYKIKGAREAEWRMNIIEGSVSVKDVLAKAREHNTTVTVLVTAMLMRAIYSEMDINDLKKPVVINVPVNLRNYFESKSTRNFFSLVDIKYDFSGHKDSLEDVIKGASECFAEMLNEEYLQNRLNRFLNRERNFIVRAVPLPLKNLYLYNAHHSMSKESTAAVSNLGKVAMPDEAKEYIKLFDVISATNKIQACLCSYEDNMNISFTSPFVSTDIQREFFRQLTNMGVQVTISANNLRGDIKEEK
ncbi:MAG: hypothetical protein FWD34_05750 [Oscillospiraceae bacterium]|nr:hypothetical protein [Oscillospiraceae bacterium]